MYPNEPSVYLNKWSPLLSVSKLSEVFLDIRQNKKAHCGRLNVNE